MDRSKAISQRNMFIAGSIACALAAITPARATAEGASKAPASFRKIDRFERRCDQMIKKATIGFQKLMPTQLAKKLTQKEVCIWKGAGYSELGALRQVSSSALGQMVKNTWRATPWAIGFNSLEGLVRTNEAAKHLSPDQFPKTLVKDLKSWAKKHPVESRWNTFRLAITPVLARTPIPGMRILNAVANGGHAVYHGLRHVAAEKLVNQHASPPTSQ